MFEFTNRNCSALSVLLSTTICVTTVAKERQCGPVVRALASRSGDPGFKTRSDHSLNLILLVPAALVDSQLVCLPPVGILNRSCCCVSFALKSTYGERSIMYYIVKMLWTHEAKQVESTTNFDHCDGKYRCRSEYRQR